MILRRRLLSFFLKKQKKSFEETFKELFKGGEAKLKLTDKSNLLETGVEIIACPPGKTLKRQILRNLRKSLDR